MAIEKNLVGSPQSRGSIANQTRGGRITTDGLGGFEEHTPTRNGVVDVVQPELGDAMMLDDISI